MVENVIAAITDFVKESPENRLPDRDEPYFAEPLVAFASAADPIFAEYKKIIGDFHQTPQEVLCSVHGAAARAATVICWVLPISPAIRLSNRPEKEFPSQEWALTRQYGEAFNNLLRRHVVEWLQASGHRAAAPLLAPGWRVVGDAPVGIASSWSERHAAYAAGLGTFSLNDALITPRGIAHRVGSVVTDLPLPASARIAPNHLDNCLRYRNGSCGACIARCPAGAITDQGHDKQRCFDYVYRVVPERVGRSWGIKETGCGLCQTAVPCEERIP